MKIFLKFTEWQRVGMGAILLIAFVFAPALIGKSIIGTDSLELVIPQLAFYKHAFEDGESPFWNPYLAVGFPNFISVAGFPYAPLHFLLYLLPAYLAHYWALFLSLAAGAVFFILFLRELGVRHWGALVGTLGYLAGNIHFARDLTLGTALFVYPALFWLVIKIHKSESWRSCFIYTGFGGLLVGYGWLMSSYFPTLYLLPAIFAFAIFLGLKSADSWRRLKKLSIALLAVLAVGFLIGSFQLVPAYVINGFSQRSQGFNETLVQDGYAITPKDLLHLLYLTPERGLDAYLFMGIVSFFLFCISFFSKEAMVKFFRWLFLIALAISLKGSPLFWFVIVKLPVFNFFQGAARFMLVGIFAAAVLVGFGADRLEVMIRGDASEARKKIFRFIAPGILVFLAISVLFSREQGAFASVALSGTFLAIALAVVWFSSNETRQKKLLPFLAILASVEFVTIFYRFNAGRIFDAVHYSTPPSNAKFSGFSKSRILPLFVDDWDDIYFFNFSNHKYLPPEELEYIVRHASYHPNTQFLWPVANLEANEPLLNVPMGRLMALLGTRQLVTSGGEEKLNKLYKKDENDIDVSLKEKYEKLKERLPLADFLGIRYFLTFISFQNSTLYSSIDLPLVGYSFLDIGGPPEEPMPMLVYENPSVKPLVYFSKVAGFKNNSEEAYQAFKAAGFKEIFVECSYCDADKKLSGEGKVEIILQENGRVEADTRSETEQFLVFTQNYLPGWRALIDGSEALIYKVNSVFPGIFVPAGNHKIEFVYDYWSLFKPSFIFAKK